MIGEYMNFVRRREHLEWSPWYSCTLRHQVRFSLLIRIKVGFQFTEAFYLETIQWGVWYMPLTLALRDRDIPVNSNPARPTQWALGQPVLCIETQCYTHTKIYRLERAQSVPHLLCNPRDLSLNPGTHIKKPRVLHAPEIPVLGTLVHLQLSLGSSSSLIGKPRFQWEAASKN